MNKAVLTILSIILISSLSFAELKLKLSADLTGETHQSLINKNVESNLNLSIPPEIVTPPSDMKEFVKGMIMLGILADVSFPFGGDNGFGHIAKTGFSGHVMAGYVVSTAFLLTLRAGYIKFGTNTTDESGPGYTASYEDKYSQVPILFGAYYLFATPGAFKPYLGLALGVFFQTYSFTWSYNYNYFGQTYSDSFEGDASSTGFGVVPGAGFYYFLGSVILTAAVEYAYIFSDLPQESDGGSYTPPQALEKINGVAQDGGGDSSGSDKASYLSVNLGIAFPLGK